MTLRHSCHVCGQPCSNTTGSPATLPARTTCSVTRESWSERCSMPASIGLDTCGFHSIAPDRRLAAHDLGEFRRRVAERLDADLAQVLRGGGLPHRLRNDLRGALDDRLRRAG